MELHDVVRALKLTLLTYQPQYFALFEFLCTRCQGRYFVDQSIRNRDFFTAVSPVVKLINKMIRSLMHDL